jgi:MFS family permease
MSGVDSSYAWWRLVASVTLSMVGGVGMWCLVVALPSVQQDLGVSRADISFAYTVNTLGFFVGGVVMGKLVDARGIVLTAVLSAIGLTLGFAAAPAGSFTTSRRWSPTSRTGSRSAGAWPSPSRPPATTSPARSGRRSSRA